MFTESGVPVGRLAGIILDTETHEAVQYAVARPRAVRDPFPRELLIARRQVVSLDEERMVVQDGSVAERYGEKAHVRGTAPEAAGLSRMEGCGERREG